MCVCVWVVRVQVSCPCSHVLKNEIRFCVACLMVYTLCVCNKFVIRGTLKMPLRVSSIQTISKAYDLYKAMHQVQLLCS